MGHIKPQACHLRPQGSFSLNQAVCRMSEKQTDVMISTALEQSSHSAVPTAVDLSETPMHTQCRHL